MSYIVCRNCKKFVKVNENEPLVFDKCKNCGHILEYATDERELQFILKGIEIPKVSYHKVCTKCKSLNPRETGACLFCGSREFQVQYDLESVNKYRESLGMGQIQVTPELLQQQTTQSQVNSTNNWLYKILSIVLGLIDFFLVITIGLGLIIKDGAIPTDYLAFAQQNLEVLSIVVIIALLVAGFMSVFVLPKTSYVDSFRSSSIIGLLLGLSTVMVSKDVLVIGLSIVLCAVITGIGGVLAEVLVHKIINKMS